MGQVRHTAVACFVASESCGFCCRIERGRYGTSIVNTTSSSGGGGGVEEAVDHLQPSSALHSSAVECDRLKRWQNPLSLSKEEGDFFGSLNSAVTFCRKTAGLGRVSATDAAIVMRATNNRRAYSTCGGLIALVLRFHDLKGCPCVQKWNSQRYSPA